MSKIGGLGHTLQKVDAASMMHLLTSYAKTLFAVFRFMHQILSNDRSQGKVHQPSSEVRQPSAVRQPSTVRHNPFAVDLIKTSASSC